MIRYLMGCLLLAAPAQADPEWAAFFDAPGAQVERMAEGTREAVTLPGSVQIVRQKQEDGWVYVGIDRSDHGAVGCVARVLREMTRAVTQCPDAFPEQNAAQLDSHTARLSEYYAQNAVPSTTASAFLEDLRSYAQQTPKLQCARITPDFLRMADQLMGADSPALIDDLLSTARLPVDNPCL